MVERRCNPVIEFPMSIKLALPVALLAMMLASCTTARQTALPGGGRGYAIGCGGIQHTMDDCLARAAEVCPGGYDVVTTTQESVPLINPYERSMYVRCR
jgi:hypothetical protein